MLPTLRSLWRTLSGKAQRSTSPHPHSSFRPLMEVLEDRAVPASLSWSNGSFNVYGTAVDGAGNVYITGNTGANLPATPGAFETSGDGAYAAKLSPTGALIYATYLGNGGSGSINDGGYNIAVDAAGDAYVIGQNSNVPTSPNAIASSGDIFVAELNPTGSTLVYGTYIPGAVGYGWTEGNAGAIAVDGSGNIDVAGGATTGLPVTAGAFQATYKDGTGGTNAFFAKINPALSGTASLVYASYLGGTGGLGDAASGIALDGSGNAYLTGYTSSSNFPTTAGAYQKTYGGGYFDAFVAKFNPSLSGSASLVYSTYLGGSGQEGYVFDDTQPYDYSTLTDGPQTDGGIVVNAAGDAYVTGSTTSTNFPTTKGAFQTTSNLTYKKGKSDSVPADAFVTELNPTGSALVYSTYLGGGTNTWSGGAGHYAGRQRRCGTDRLDQLDRLPDQEPHSGDEQWWLQCLYDCAESVRLGPDLFHVCGRQQGRRKRGHGHRPERRRRRLRGRNELCRRHRSSRGAGVWRRARSIPPWPGRQRPTERFRPR